MVEHLPSMLEALGLLPRKTKQLPRPQQNNDRKSTAVKKRDNTVGLDESLQFFQPVVLKQRYVW